MRAKEAERAAQMFAKKRLEPDAGNDGEDMFFDAKEFHTSNKQVANILSSAETPVAQATSTVAASAVQNAKWGDDDDIDIDADDLLDANDESGAIEELKESMHQDSTSDIFVPPSQGADLLAIAVKKHPLVAGLQVAVGDFPKALDLLKKQLAIGNFEALK